MMSPFCCTMQSGSSSTLSTTWWGQQWHQEQQRYCWWILDDLPDWPDLMAAALGVLAEGTVTWRRPGTSSWPLLNLEPFGYEFMALCAVYEMACFLCPLVCRG